MRSLGHLGSVFYMGPEKLPEQLLFGELIKKVRPQHGPKEQ